MNLLLWHLLNGWRQDGRPVVHATGVWVPLSVRRSEGKYLPMGPFSTGPLLPEHRDARA